MSSLDSGGGGSGLWQAVCVLVFLGLEFLVGRALCASIDPLGGGGGFGYGLLALLIAGVGAALAVSGAKSRNWQWSAVSILGGLVFLGSLGLVLMGIESTSCHTNWLAPVG